MTEAPPEKQKKQKLAMITFALIHIDVLLALNIFLQLKNCYLIRQAFIQKDFYVHDAHIPVNQAVRSENTYKLTVITIQNTTMDMAVVVNVSFAIL